MSKTPVRNPRYSLLLILFFLAVTKNSFASDYEDSPICPLAFDDYVNNESDPVNIVFFGPKGAGSTSLVSILATLNYMISSEICTHYECEDRSWARIQQDIAQAPIPDTYFRRGSGDAVPQVQNQNRDSQFLLQLSNNAMLPSLGIKYDAFGNRSIVVGDVVDQFQDLAKLRLKSEHALTRDFPNQAEIARGVRQGTRKSYCIHSQNLGDRESLLNLILSEARGVVLNPTVTDLEELKIEKKELLSSLVEAIEQGHHIGIHMIVIPLNVVDLFSEQSAGGQAVNRFFSHTKDFINALRELPGDAGMVKVVFAATHMSDATEDATRESIYQKISEKLDRPAVDPHQNGENNLFLFDNGLLHLGAKTHRELTNAQLPPELLELQHDRPLSYQRSMHEGARLLVSAQTWGQQFPIADDEVIDMIQERIPELLTDGSHLRRDHDHLRGDHNTLNGSHNTLSANHDTLRAEHNTLNVNHATLQRNHNDLNDRHDDLDGKHNTLRQEYNGTSKTLQEHRDWATRENDHRKKDNTNRKNEHDKLRRNYDETAKDFKKHTHWIWWENNARENDINDMKPKVKKLNDQYERNARGSYQP